MIQSCIVCICLTFLQCVFTNVSSNRQLEIMNSNINCICLVFLHCAFPNVYSKSLGQHRQSHTVCTFSGYQIVLKMLLCGDIELHKVVRQLLLLLQGEGNHLQKGVLLHLLQLMPCHSSLAMYMGRLCSLWATTKSSKVRAAISRMLCSSISSILYLFITMSLQFGDVHGQALLFV